MFISIHCGGLPFNGNTIPEGESLGGSETAAYYMAKELVKLGHEVYVFTNNKNGGVFDGVRYEWCGNMLEHAPLGERYKFASKVPFDISIIQRHPAAFTSAPNSKLNIWWLHDMALIRNSGAVQRHLVNIDQVFTVSEFHKSQVCGVYDIPNDFVTAIKNGIDYDAFPSVDLSKKEPRSLIYIARPERGLENLVGGDDCIMNQLKDCKLYVCGYDNTVPQMAEYYKYLWSRCHELPNVELVGCLGKKDLYELMSKCMIYTYPTTFEDTSCIAALEANAAGLPVVGYKWSALPETLKDGGAILLKMEHDESGNPCINKKQYADAVKSLLGNKDQYNALRSKALQKKQSWATQAKEWDIIFKDLLAEKSSNADRLYKHYEHTSDIVAMCKHAGSITKIKVPDFEKNYDFFLNSDYKEHYKKYYAHEKESGVNYGPEDLSHTPRFRILNDVVAGFKPARVLDYGCAHGPYTVNMASRHPDWHITGIDINEANIDIARKWALDEDIKNVEFFEGEQYDVTGQYDVVVISEVLEHVPNPNEVMEKLALHVSPGGHMVISVPYGPWESIGYDDEKNKGWRAHIHHYERPDLLEMFGKQKGYNLVALPSIMEGYGHFILSFQPTGVPFGKINYERKSSQQSPQETLSVVILAKDVECIIGKTINSIKNIADEIIVAVDETTEDETERVCKKLGAKTIIVPSPLEIGFDKARNILISHATKDWILWIDSDETLENADNIKKYLRANCYNGYAVPQHHYAVEPASLFQTDFPVRLFRNNKNIQFFGVVHEHPEIDLNKSVGKVTKIDDIGIMHTGYSTEAIRRKRFQRNFPLMQRDREKNPERRLGKFLWLRDLMHYVKFKSEQNGNTLTQETIDICHEAAMYWRELIDIKETRFVLEGLKFYSEAVKYLAVANQCKPISFSFNVQSAPGDMIDKLNVNNVQPITGLFACKEDIQTLTQYLIDDKIKVFTEKYF